MRSPRKFSRTLWSKDRLVVGGHRQGQGLEVLEDSRGQGLSLGTTTLDFTDDLVHN